MRVAVFATKPYDERYLTAANERGEHGHDLTFFETRLTSATAPLADGHDAVCAFVNDDLGATTLQHLHHLGVSTVALRASGFNNTDLLTADRLGLTVCRVPAYSPYAVAEHTLSLLLALNRKIHRAWNRVREHNFALNGLLGFDINDKTVGIIGTGQIGRVFARIMHGLGCHILAYDPYPSDEITALGGEYVGLSDLFRRSDIISLHTPLTPETYHLINGLAIAQMKDGVVLLNTSRGALVETVSAIEGLKSGKIGALGLDVYEEEGDLFFEDLSDQVLRDDVFSRLLTFPNVVVTGHQAFFTDEAMAHIAETTLSNLSNLETGEGEVHTIGPEMLG